MTDPEPLKSSERGHIHLPLALFGLAAGLLIAFFAFMSLSGKFLPGPVSAASPRNQELGGYVSHAEFEQQCIHCHAPLHCVTDTRCQDCHMDIAQQRATASGLHSLLPGTERCQNCHKEHRGRDATITEMAFANINHEKLANFSLAQHQHNYDGSSMSCGSCHSNERFMKDTLDCISCHADADHDYLSSHIEAYGAGCIDCHDGRDRMMAFDHDQYYPLDGAHKPLECDNCHIQKQYAVTVRDCAGCHAEPELHAGVFGLDCARCHNSVAWAPAQLVQHTFVIAHGDEDITGCETCHAGTYTEYPCFSCHTAEAMRWEHLLLDILDTSNCIECHPTGRESDTANAQIQDLVAGNEQRKEVTSSGY
jgi:hypothetical protein